MQNTNFLSVIKQLRAIMPKLGVAMVLLVYVVSAYAGGSFLADLGVTALLAYGIAIAIQFTRAVIVFFNQMNPGRPIFGYTGEACAVIFGGFSVYEMYFLTQESQHPAVFVSVALLMVAGIVIEIMLLREVKYATEQELISNPALVQDIQNNAISHARLKQQLEQISAALTSGNTLPATSNNVPSAPPVATTPPPVPVAPTPPPVDNSDVLTHKELLEIVQKIVDKTLANTPSGKVAPTLLEELDLSLNGASGNGNGKH